MRPTLPSRSSAVGSLRPIQIPELRYHSSSSSSSPSSADAGFSSPDSDIVRTPFTGQTFHHSPMGSVQAPVRISNGSMSSISGSVYAHISPFSPPCIPALSAESIYPASGRKPDLLVDESFESGPPPPSPFSGTPVSSPGTPLSPYQRAHLNACLYSQRFPVGHMLNVHFAEMYALGDELGAGGYGFVMTAHDRHEGHEVAVKFIIKSKVPENAWVEEESIGRIPTEIMLLSLIDHENIVKCLDVFEDNLFFYLVQELHGSPWTKAKRKHRRQFSEAASSPIPVLSPSYSDVSLADCGPPTPPLEINFVDRQQVFPSPEVSSKKEQSRSQRPSLPLVPPRPSLSARRPSHDLFEFIEQSKHKQLTEDQARHIFSQVVEAIFYLDTLGISHRDIKDENLVIDSDLKVKLIDFGSAIISDPSKPRPFYEQFLGTPAYAASEILQKKSYQAPAAEVWTLGVLLSYLLTGMSPFMTQEDAILGRASLVDKGGADARPSSAAKDLLKICLEADPTKRASIGDVRSHCWLRGGLGMSL